MYYEESFDEFGKYRNDYRKNVVLCGYTEEEKNKIRIYDVKECIFDEYTPYKKCPHVIYVSTLEEAFKHKGLILFLKIDENLNIIEFDKKYRKKLDYWYIYLYNEKLKYKKNSKFSNITVFDKDDMFADYYEGFISEINWYFKKHPKLKMHEKRRKLLDNIHKYLLKGNIEKTSKEISEAFNISIRNVERYMNDIYLLYNDIGYDYLKNTWYICK